MIKTLPQTAKKQKPGFNHLHQKAFDNSLMANIISVVHDGKIIAVNQAAEKLLGYPKKILLTKNIKDIFNTEDREFTHLRKLREIAGYAHGNLIGVKKSGKTFPCQVTSVIFTGDNHIEKAITTLIDRSEGIRRQKQIDLKKERKAADKIATALSLSNATLTRLDVLEHKLDKEITAKEQSQLSSRIQQRLFKKEWKAETRLKEIQIEDAVSEAKEVERSDLGKELHDNVNQLLAASRIYLDIGRRIEANRESNLNRSSEYTLSAIEEIRKLARGLINNAVKNIGLCDAIHKMTHDLMEVYPIKITCAMDPEIHLRMNAKFNQDIFRIVQEQLNNIVKHAHASVVTIDFIQNKEAIQLTIADDGIGFDVSKESNGIGIINIKSRAAFYRGNARFNTEPGKGCILTVTFPLATGIMNNH